MLTPSSVFAYRMRGSIAVYPTSFPLSFRQKLAGVQVDNRRDAPIEHCGHKRDPPLVVQVVRPTGDDGVDQAEQRRQPVVAQALGEVVPSHSVLGQRAVVGLEEVDLAGLALAGGGGLGPEGAAIVRSAAP